MPTTVRTLCLLSWLLCLSACDRSASQAARELQQAELETLEAQQAQQAASAEATAKLVEPLLAAGGKVDYNSAKVPISVDLRGQSVTDALAAQLAQVTSLEKLTIDQSSMSLEGWTRLAALSNLQQLDLRDCPLDNEQLIAAVSGMPKLKALRLSGKSGATTVDDGGMSVLNKLPELKVLAIDDLWITTAGLEPLAKCTKLTEFYAGGTTIDDAAAEVLAKIPSLRKLRLARTGIGTAGLETLAVVPIEELDISEASGIDDDSLAAVGKMTSLKRLNVWRDTVSDTGAAHLQGLTNMEWLNLDNTHISDAALPHLKGMLKLNFLHLGSTAVTDKGMPDLTGLKSLKDLKVTRTAVTEAGVEVVRTAIPGVDIQLKYIEGE